MADASSEIRGRCGDCDHRWVVVHLPMDIVKAAKVMARVCCPNCGNTGKNIFVDMPAAGASHG